MKKEIVNKTLDLSEFLPEENHGFFKELKTFCDECLKDKVPLPLVSGFLVEGKDYLEIIREDLVKENNFNLEQVTKEFKNYLEDIKKSKVTAYIQVLKARATVLDNQDNLVTAEQETDPEKLRTSDHCVMFYANTPKGDYIEAYTLIEGEEEHSGILSETPAIRIFYSKEELKEDPEIALATFKIF